MHEDSGDAVEAVHGDLKGSGRGLHYWRFILLKIDRVFQYNDKIWISVDSNPDVYPPIDGLQSHTTMPVDNALRISTLPY